MGLEHLVDRVPAGVRVFPERLVHEDEDAAGLRAVEVLAQPLQLRVAEPGLGLERLVRVEADEVDVAVVEGVVERAEVLLVQLLPAMVVHVAGASDHVVVAGDGEEGGLQAGQDGLDLRDVALPPVHVAHVARDQVADVDDEVGLEHVEFVDGLLEHGQAGGHAGGAVTEDGDGEALGGRGHAERDRGVGAGVHLRGIGPHGAETEGEEDDRARQRLLHGRTLGARELVPDEHTAERPASSSRARPCLRCQRTTINEQRP